MPDDLLSRDLVRSSAAALPIEIDAVARALAEATAPDEALAIEKQLGLAERYLRESGRIEEIRPVNELRMRARWKLGQLLAAVERERTIGPGRGHRGEKTMSVALTSFRALLRKLELDPDTAMKAQRIGMLPEAELELALAAAHKADTFASFADLANRARPFWQRANRVARHQRIEADAGVTGAAEIAAMQFPLIYADPPWYFKTYTKGGGGRAPDNHYPTLPDQEIVDFAIGGKPMREIAHKDAAIFLWCTNSNIPLALRVLEGWGFTFSTSAAWVKNKQGMGLVFRNWHEVLLYGTRGKMPGPLYVPPSVFKYPRGEHSAKPRGVRGEIERMFPHFGDATLRLELFARAPVPGWSVYGNQSH